MYPPCILLSLAMISTHAPARGATQLAGDPLRSRLYFNPRPCTRSDTRAAVCMGGVRHFNPRPCTRSDRIAVRVLGLGVYFNPRPCTRSDRLLVLWFGAGQLFQPTPLHEERHGGASVVALYCEFQPTPLHEERQLAAIKANQLSGISTHAPARGATPGGL